MLLIYKEERLRHMKEEKSCNIVRRRTPGEVATLKERLREIVCKSSHTSRMNCQRGSDTNDDHAKLMMIIEHTIVVMLNILF